MADVDESGLVALLAFPPGLDGLWAAFTARDELERLNKEIRDIQEEARRVRVPAGWLR